MCPALWLSLFFFFKAEAGIGVWPVPGVRRCALPFGPPRRRDRRQLGPRLRPRYRSGGIGEVGRELHSGFAPQGQGGYSVTRHVEEGGGRDAGAVRNRDEPHT